MRLRHRVPTIFNLSMLDMLCCSLGAVILLMLLHMWDARRQAAVLRETTADFERRQKELEESEHQLQRRDLEIAIHLGEKAHALALLDARGRDLNEQRARLRTAQIEIAGLRRDLLHATTQAAASQSALAAATADMAKERRLALEWKTKAEAAMRELQSARATADMVPELKATLAEAQARLLKEKDAADRGLAELKAKEKKLADLADALKAAMGERDALASRLKAKEDDLLAMTKKADEAGNKLALLEKSSQSLSLESSKLQKLIDEQRGTIGRLKDRLDSAEGRFAGVDLSGQDVILLIDVSGSMGSVDADATDPNKWPEVCRTVVQVLKSLPDLRRYQIILFSDEVRYLNGSGGDWLEFDRKTTPGEVADALAQIKTKGNTNMFAAFETAFRYRSEGLDAVYLFSDGLPNIGPGLPTQPPRDEAAQSALLGKHVRDTIKDKWNRGPKPVRIHGVGFYYESPNLGAFLWALSRENGGSFVGMSKP